MQAQNFSQGLSQIDSVKKEISLYGKGKVTSRVLADCVIRIKKSFPKLPDGWYEMLNEMIDLEGFTDQRLADATLNLIKTCPYPEPTIANILSFDKIQKLYTYEQLQWMSKDMSKETAKNFWNKCNKTIDGWEMK